MKVTICAINSKFIHSSLSAWCLAGGIEKYAPQTEYRVVEATINEKRDDIIKRIVSEGFDIIGFSVYIWNKSLIMDIAREIKKKTGAFVALGGPEVSYNAREILKEYEWADAIISGEGEEPFAKLCNAVPYEDIEGLCYREGDRIVIKEPHISTDDPPSPYVERYFKSLNGRIAYIETSRGCPFRCAFCLSGRCGGVRFFDLKKSKENIIKLSRSGTQTVKFVDRTFNADKKRAKEILTFIVNNCGKEIPRGVCFHLEMEGRLIDDETIDILATAPKGLFQLEIGVQSFNKKTLEYIYRKAELELLEENVKKLLALKNVHIHIDLIAGLPFENWDSFSESFNKAYELRPHMLQLGFLKLLHGADMREDTERYKLEFSHTPPYEIISNEWLTKEELVKLHILEDVFEKAYSSGRFPRTCGYLTQKFPNAFLMFLGFGEYMHKRIKNKTPDDLTEGILEYFSVIDTVDSAALRDCLAEDRLATNRMGYLPSAIRIHSPKIKEYMTLLEQNEGTRRKKGVKRSATLLPTKNEFVYVDYDNFDPVTGGYQLKYIPLNTK